MQHIIEHGINVTKNNEHSICETIPNQTGEKDCARRIQTLTTICQLLELLPTSHHHTVSGNCNERRVHPARGPLASLAKPARTPTSSSTTAHSTHCSTAIVPRSQASWSDTAPGGNATHETVLGRRRVSAPAPNPPLLHISPLGPSGRRGSVTLRRRRLHPCAGASRGRASRKGCTVCNTTPRGARKGQDRRASRSCDDAVFRLPTCAVQCRRPPRRRAMMRRPAAKFDSARTMLLRIGIYRAMSSVRTCPPREGARPPRTSKKRKVCIRRATGTANSQPRGKREEDEGEGDRKGRGEGAAGDGKTEGRKGLHRYVGITDGAASM